MFREETLVSRMPLVPRQLADVSRELACSVPLALRDHQMPDGAFVQLVLSVEAKSRAAVESFTGRIMVPVESRVLTALMTAGTIVTLSNIRRDEQDLLGDASMCTVRVPDFCCDGACPHGSYVDGAPWARVRLWCYADGEWIAEAGQWLGLPCCCAVENNI